MKNKKNQSKWFSKVKSWYNAEFWTKKMVRNAVKKKWITAAEFEEITGEKYD